jgi:hypothetical protein
MRLSWKQLAVVAALGASACVPGWARNNSSPYIIEIAAITNAGGTLPIHSDVSFPVVNDIAQVTVNIFRKNNQPTLSTSPVEHVYLKRYEVRYVRTDGRSVEGVDVPYRISGPLGNIRFHTPGPGGGGEVQAVVSIDIVRQQAKLEAPLKQLQGGVLGDTSLGVLPQAGVVTMIAIVTIDAETVEGDALEAQGSVEVTFADFPNA